MMTRAGETQSHSPTRLGSRSPRSRSHLLRSRKANRQVGNPCEPQSSVFFAHPPRHLVASTRIHALAASPAKTADVTSLYQRTGHSGFNHTCDRVFFQAVQLSARLDPMYSK